MSFAVLLLASAALLLPAPPVFSQTQPDDTSSPLAFTVSVQDTSEVESDSTVAATGTSALLDSLRALRARTTDAWMGPFAYSTGYSLNRNTSSWDQSLKFELFAHGVSVTTITTSNLYADTETGSDRRNASTRVSIDYDAGDHSTIGLDLNTSRHKDNFLAKQYNTDQVLAKAIYSWHESEKFAWSVTARAGSVNETKPTHEGRGTTSNLELSALFVPLSICSLSVGATGDLANKRSQSVFTGIETRDRDVNEAFEASLDVRPVDIMSLAVNFNKASSTLQYPVGKLQETWVSTADGVDGTLHLDIRGDSYLLLSGRYKDNEVSYDIDSTKSTSFLSKSASVDFVPPRYARFAVTSRFNVEQSSSVQGTGRTGDTETRMLSGSLVRPITKLISANASGNVSLTQYFFYDLASAGDDRDIYKDAFSFGLGLGQSGKAYSGTVTFKRDMEKMIYVRAVNSGNNRTTELYSLIGSFTYRRGNILFTQNASMTAGYNLLHFNEDQNTLSRTTNIASSIELPFRNRGSFKLSHAYRVQDSGTYGTPEGSDVTVYMRSGGSVTEELNLTTAYKFTPAIDLSIAQRHQRSRTFAFASERKFWGKPRKVLELLQDLKMSYKVDEKSTITVRLAKTNSAFGTGYWNGMASFSRNFF
ncbi:MAG: hypothetical protein V2A71_02470 [Candidatus Eisenbacteria bacterium]